MKENYTSKEIEIIEKALNAYDNYIDAKGNYSMVKYNFSDKNSLEFVKEKLNKSVEECRKNIPKGLVNRLGIKKVK